jgi:hypothetical protein
VVGDDVADARSLDRIALDAGCHRAIIVKQVPLDRRHQSKIDYPALLKMLRTKGYARRRPLTSPSQ